MDFKNLKQKAIDLKNKAIDLTDKGILKVSEKLGESSLVIKTAQELEDFTKKSENKTHVNNEGVTKVFTKRVFLVLGDSKDNFFKEFLILIPVLLAKSFSQNISLKMADISNDQIDYKKYEVSDFPCMIVFENNEIYKIIVGENNIKTIIKDFNLDINKTIDNI